MCKTVRSEMGNRHENRRENKQAKRRNDFKIHLKILENLGNMDKATENENETSTAKRKGEY